MNSIKKIALTFSVLLALLAGDAFAQCTGKVVHIKLPSNWGFGTNAYMIWEGQWKTLTGNKVGEWTTFTIPTVSNDAPNKNEIIFSDQNTYNNQTVNINTITHAVYSNSKDLISTNKFTCSDFGPNGTWIMEDPTTPGKTVTSTQPPNARYFYFYPPKEDDWILGTPYLKVDNAAAVAMEIEPDKCGWYKMVYFNKPAPSDSARILLGLKGTDKLGIKGVDEDPVDWGPNGPTPFNLKKMFDDKFGEDKPGSLYFVAQKGEVDGWTTTDPGMNDISRCRYSFAARIYFRGKTGSSFTNYKDNNAASEGICRGYVKNTLDTSVGGRLDGKMVWNGRPAACATNYAGWLNETDFNNAFKSTPGQNTELCYDMPFERQKSSGLWEFDAFYMCPDGSTMDYSSTATTGCTGAGGPGSMGGFYLPGSMLGGITGILTYDGDRVSVADSTKWCYDRGWLGTGKGDLTGKTTKDAINAEMRRVCTREFRDGDLISDNEIKFTWGTGRKDVSGLLCFESAPAEFVYQPGQEFFFRGDDDIWVFINNKLAVDLGGNHMPAPGYVKLDTLGLTEGEKYPLKIFFCDRRAPGSNVRITTNMYFSQQSGIKLTGDAKGSGGADICIERDGGKGDCKAVAGGSTGPQILCGDKIDLSKIIAFYIRNRSGSAQYKLNNIDNTGCYSTGAPGEYKCYSGVTVNTKTGNAKINNDAVTGLTGTWYLYVTVIDPTIPGIEDMKVGTIFGKSSIRMAWGNIVVEENSSNSVNICKNPITAVTGELVPICIADGNQTSDNSFDAVDAGGSSFKLVASNNHNGNRLKAFYDPNGEFPADLNNPLTIPGGSGGAPRAGSGSIPGVLVLWVTGDYDQQIDSDTYTINVSGRAAAEQVTLTSLIPYLQWTKAPGGAALATGANKGSVWVNGDPEQGVQMDGTSPAAVWVGESIKLHLRAQRDGKTCTSCNYPLSLAAKATGTNNPPTEQDGSLITFRGLNIVKGEAVLDIAGRKTVLDPNYADITVQGVSGVSKIDWTELQFMEPPVPVPENVQIFDDDGDGVGDRLVIAYNQHFRRDSLPNAIRVHWGKDAKEVVTYGIGKGTWDAAKNDSIYPLVTDTTANRAYWEKYLKQPIKTSDWKSGGDTIELKYSPKYGLDPSNKEPARFSNDVLTRNKDGKIVSWISFKTNKGVQDIGPSPPIEDKIPAIIVNASYAAGTIEGCGTSVAPCRDKVALAFSEPVVISVTDPTTDEMRNPFAYQLIEYGNKDVWDRLSGTAIPSENDVRYGRAGNKLRPTDVVGDSTVNLTFDRYNDGAGNKTATPMPGDSVKFAALGKGYAGFTRTILADLNGNAPNPEERGRKLEGRKPYTPEKLPIGEIDPNYPNYYVDKIKEYLKENKSDGDYSYLFGKDRPIELLPIPPECDLGCVKQYYPGTIGMIFNPDIFNELADLDVPDENITIYPRAFFHTNLGLYVADNIFPDGIKCNDKIFPTSDKTNKPSCRDGRSKFYIAWDMKDTKGRFVGAGAYVGIYDFRWEFFTPALGTQKRDEIERKVEMHGVKRVKLKQ